jgi:hypothetical protein
MRPALLVVLVVLGGCGPSRVAVVPDPPAGPAISPERQQAVYAAAAKVVVLTPEDSLEDWRAIQTTAAIPGEGVRYLRLWAFGLGAEAVLVERVDGELVGTAMRRP